MTFLSPHTPRLMAVATAFLLAACAGGPPPAAEAPTLSATVAPAAPAPPPADLIGMAARELERTLGAPGLKRTDPPAEVWQYARAACTVNLFLYAPENGAQHRVEHIEAFDKNGASVDPAQCLAGAVGS